MNVLFHGKVQSDCWQSGLRTRVPSTDVSVVPGVTLLLCNSGEEMNDGDTPCTAVVVLSHPLGFREAGEGDCLAGPDGPAMRMLQYFFGNVLCCDREPP